MGDIRIYDLKFQENGLFCTENEIYQKVNTSGTQVLDLWKCLKVIGIYKLFKKIYNFPF